MKKLISVCCVFSLLLSSGLPVQAATETESPVQYDIAAYVEEHFRRSDGAAVHFLDPTGWYSREITKAPDFGNFEGFAYLYTDDLEKKYLAGDWSGSLMLVTVFSYFDFDLCEVSEEDAAAFDAVMTEFAASRDTLVYKHDSQNNRQLDDYALHTDTAELLMKMLDARPEVKALISQIQYTPVYLNTININTIGGLKFMTPDGSLLSEDRLRILADESDLSWIIGLEGTVSPETVTTESLIEVLSIVSDADPVILKPSGLAESSYELQIDDVRLLYQKGDVDGDGQITAYDASLALNGFNEATVLGLEPGDRTLTPEQEALADVDGDGALTAYDATCILTYFTLKSNAGFDDLTWADVLPAK